ncbi:ABC transporter ATP-binding protein [Ensifer sp. ENS09]|uniref:ABC transporter ATP-binding protein n=1 Tax=Ensifer sp. ENS09 TaxID=2769263 RepID=UPI00177AFB1F|nr:ABC transporter ATP-binding protein [Ensifer sp. ENS09]MBD9653131.1 ABC transporter ATP-binding protein [Ensifer sp. ENS09]
MASTVNKLTLIKRLIDLEIKLDRTSLFVVLALAIMSAILPMGLPLLFGLTINRLLSGDKLWELWPLFCYMMLLSATSAIAAIESSRRATRIGYSAAQHVSRRVYENVLKMPYLTYTTINQGVLISRLTNDIRMLEPMFVTVPLAAVRGWTSIITAAFALTALDPWYLLGFVVVPISLVLVRYAEAQINETIEASFEDSGRLSSIIENTTGVDAINLIRQAGATETEVANFDKASRDAADNSTILEFWRSSISTFYDMSFSLVSIFVLGIATLLASLDISSVGGAISALLYIGILRHPLSELISLRYPIIRGSIGLKRVEDVLTSPNSGLASISKPSAMGATIDTISAQAALRPASLLAFESVWFRYPSIEQASIEGLSNVSAAQSATGFAGTASLTSLKIAPNQEKPTTVPDWAVKDLTLSIQRGQTVAVAGMSGSGKSTIVGLACGLLRPSRGRVLLEGNDTLSMSEEEIRSKVSLVSQDTYLRNTTLRENLSYVAPTSSNSDLLEACHLAGLTELLERLPEGMDTLVGAQGRRFSGGERQRISIARALLTNSEILVLDEATSQLDATREAGVLESIDLLRKSRAVLVIAHRRSAVSKSDFVVMVENGVVAEVGKHTDLINSHGPYSRMHAADSGS